MKRTAALAIALVSVVLSSCPDAFAGKPVDWDKKLVKARQLIDTNNCEEAMKIIQDFMKKHPESGALHTEMGKALKQRGKMGQAKAQFKRSTEVESTYAPAWYELGAMQEVDKEYKIAIDSYERYLQMDPATDRKGAVQERIAFCKSKLE
jgi:tetratricopeptide (TPR) repeat protein